MFEREADWARAGLWLLVLVPRVLCTGSRRHRSWLGSIWLCYRHNLQPNYAEFLVPGACDPADVIDISRCGACLRWVRAFGDRDQAHLIDDKSAFGAYFSSHGLPVAREFARIAPDNKPPAPPDEARFLFVKRSFQQGGNGVSSWARDGNEWVSKGRRLVWEQLVARLRADLGSPDEMILVQERLRNHRDISDLSESALNTLRIVTLIDPDRPDAGPVVVTAAYRMGVRDHVVDNADRGGIASGVSGEVLTDAVNIYTCEVHAAHPTTGAPIRGRVLPMYEEAAELALQAHRVVPGVITVGWDIALTDRGPVLIEGNTLWGFDLVQVPNQVGIGATAFAAVASLLERDPPV